jgi:hypothetical protein
MPLQLRRGTTAERLSIVPLPGEPIYDTDLDTIFIGNGIAAGGISAITGITSEDAQDIIGQMFVNGQHDGLIFTYGPTQDAAGRIDAKLDLSNYDGEFVASAFRGSLFADDSGLIIDSSTKNISANDVSASTITVQSLSVDTLNLTNFAVADFKGSVFADDSTLLVDATNSAINLDGTVKGDIIPDTNEAYDLGSNATRFKDLYLSGTSLFLGSAQITAAGSAVNLPAGSTVDGVSIGTGLGTGDGVVAGSNYNINIVGDDSTLIVDSDLKIFTGNLLGNVTGNVVGNVTGDTTGYHTGDVTGSIFGDDSTKIVDAVAKEVYAAGGFFGNLQGNITTNFISSADSSPIQFGVPAFFSNRITVDDDITMNNGGTLLLNSDESTSNLQIATHSDSDQSGSILMRRSRGTAASPAALQTNDRIHQLNFNAFDGNNYINAAAIQARVTGTVSAGVVPSSLRFFINNTAGNEVESLRIDETGSVRSFSTLFCIASDGQNNSTPVNISNHHNTSTNACNLVLSRTRGTNQSPTAVQNNDPIFDLVWSGHDGSSLIGSSFIRTVVDGAVSTGIVPGRIDIYTQDTIGGYATRMQINSAKITMNAMPVLPTYADETAADASIGGAGNRVNGMMYYDTAVGAVRAVVAGAWTSL